MSDKAKPNPNDSARDPWVRVVDKQTGHESSQRKSRVDLEKDLWKASKEPAVDHNGDPLPPTHAPRSGSAKSGQKADTTTPKEG